MESLAVYCAVQETAGFGACLGRASRLHRIREARTAHIYQALLAALKGFHDDWEQKAFPKLQQQGRRCACHLPL